MAILPELKTGDTLIGRGGYEYIVHKVTGKGKRETGYDEPTFKLERTIVCNGQYTHDELQGMGLTLKETP